MKNNIELPDYLSILEYSVKEINFVLTFYEGTSKQEFVEKEWNEICSLQDAKVRAEKKAQFCWIWLFFQYCILGANRTDCIE